MSEEHADYLPEARPGGGYLDQRVTSGLSGRGCCPSLATSTARLNEAVHELVVPLARSNGSTTPPNVRYVHFANATARTIGLRKSDAAVIKALPPSEQALLSLIRQGVAERIPFWAAQAQAEGGSKPHNRILTWAKQWAETEAKVLRACGFEDVIAPAEARPALEATP